MLATKQFKQPIWEKNSPKINMNASLYLYIIIAAFGIFAQFFSFDFLYKVEPSIFKQLAYFTNISCLIMALDALAMAISLNLIKKKNLQYIPKSLNIINLTATTCVTLTMLVTILIFLPATLILKDKSPVTTESLFTKANFMFHLILPIFSIFAYIFYAKDSGIKKIETLYTAVPVVIYVIFYVIVAYTHIDPSTGKPLPDYDWYNFCAYGPIPAIAMSFAMIGSQVGLGFLLRFGNQKIKVDKFVVNFCMQSMIIALSIVGTCWYFSGEEWWEPFKWFTNLSNWLFAVTTVVYLVYLVFQYQGKINKLPIWVSKFRHCGVVAVVLTFIIVVLLFMPFLMLNGESIDSLFSKRNLVFHILIPLMALASYLAFEHNELSFKQTLYSLIASTFYMTVYTILGYCLRNSNLDPRCWDWYQLSTVLGPYWSWIMPIGTAGLTLLISSLIWIGNRKNDLESDKPIILFSFTKQLVASAKPKIEKKKAERKAKKTK